MSEHIGLSYSEIDSILKECFSPEKPVKAELIRNTIAKVIDENNKKLLLDIENIMKK